MTVVLLRVDERLIHGQVVVGWGGELHPDRFVVVDDRICVSDFEKDIYALSVPVDSEVRFLSISDAIDALPMYASDSSRTVVLLRTIDALHGLASQGALEDLSVNLGGLHPAAGRIEVLPFLNLTAADRDALLDLLDRGIAISARELPSSPETSCEELESRLRSAA